MSFHHHFLVIDGSDVGYIAFMSTFLRERFQLPITKQRLVPQSLHGFWVLHLTKQSFRNRKLYLHCYSILSTKVSDKHFFKLYRSVLFFLISHLKFILSFSLLSTCSFKLLSCNFFKIKFCSMILLQNLLITQELTKLSEKYL